MKLIMPTFNYEFLVEKDGIYAVNKDLPTQSDKSLYQSFLKLLNIDFKNAPIAFQDGNIMQQKIEYVVRVNKYLKLQLVDKINIKKNTEVLNITDGVKYPVENTK